MKWWSEDVERQDRLPPNYIKIIFRKILNKLAFLKIKCQSTVVKIKIHEWDDIFTLRHDSDHWVNWNISSQNTFIIYTSKYRFHNFYTLIYMHSLLFRLTVLFPIFQHCFRFLIIRCLTNFFAPRLGFDWSRSFIIDLMLTALLLEFLKKILWLTNMFNDIYLKIHESVVLAKALPFVKINYT